MYITSISVSGFRDLPAADLVGLERVVALEGPGPATTALGDAIELAFAALSAEGLIRLLRRWEVAGPSEEISLAGEPFPEQATWSGQTHGRLLVADESRPHLRVTLALTLDPPLYGVVRSEAMRDPKVATALARGSSVQLSVGALFARSFDAIAISINKVTIGDTAFPTAEGDRPRWLTRLLQAMAGRFHRHDPTESGATRALAAMSSVDRFQQWQAWSSALLPDGPRLRVARGPQEQPVLLGDDLPLRRHGAATMMSASIAAAVHLHEADMVWAQSGLPLLAAATRGQGSPLEQVFQICPEGEPLLEPSGPDTFTRPSAFPSTLTSAEE